ncbi:MAG: hypothetical protein KJ706_05410 [Candidatus Omnitrophica bacterium]|nr:hypothetical protein [Candidatus Omnitrophota bacterium]MBU4589735.1 hypothetical protein [Candidatus Omnitrophota bacterium]
MIQNLKNTFKTIFFLALFVNVIFMPEFSYAANRSLWQKRQAQIKDTTETQKPIKKTFHRLVDPLKVEIPEEYGTIIESHRGSNGILIVHIQDAHANYEGQMNLAHILESLIKDYELSLILVEGGSTDADFTYLRNRASLEERKEKANNLLEDGVIAGEEYLNIASDYPMSFQGIEDRSVYDANVDAMWEVDKFKETALEYIGRLIAASETLKPRIYNKELIALDRAKKDYDAEKTDLLFYYKYLYSKAIETGLSLVQFPNFANLIKASELEKKLDVEKIKAGKATNEEIILYKEYAEASKELDINKLFKEEPLLEDALREGLAENPDQKTLIKVSKTLSIMEGLLNLKVVPEEYHYFLENKKDFDPRFWQGFLNKRESSYNLSLKIPANYAIISDNILTIEHFYKVAEERNNVFLKKTNERVEKDGVKLAALIAGGFHTPMLTRLLADSGYSYIVVSPKITEATDEEFYRSTLRRQWLSE